MTLDLDNIYKQLHNKNTLCSYKGILTSDLVEQSLNNIEEKLSKENKKIKRKAYYVSVETLQNLYHHSEPTKKEIEGIQKDQKFSMFIFSKLKEDHFELSTGNFISKKTMQFLKSRIGQLNFLEKEELRILYKRILNNEEFSDKGGGGLGMIDILRKTGNKYEYNFIKYDENLYFYTLTIKIT